MSHSVRSAHARLASLSRHRPWDRPAIEAAQRDLTRAQAVARASTLTAEAAALLAEAERS